MNKQRSIRTVAGQKKKKWSHRQVSAKQGLAARSCHNEGTAQRGGSYWAVTPRCQAGAVAEAVSGWSPCPGSPPRKCPRAILARNCGFHTARMRCFLWYTRWDSQTVVQVALEINCKHIWLDPPCLCLGSQLAGECGCSPHCHPTAPMGTLGEQWGKVLRGAHKPWKKGDRKYSPISVYFDAEKETEEKAHRVLPCNHCLASRSDAAGRVYCRGFPHLPGFSSILGLFDGWSLLGFPSCHPLALPRRLQQHFPGKDNETGEQSGWAFLWKLFRYAPRLKSYLEHTIISHSTHSSSYFKECCSMKI